MTVLMAERPDAEVDRSPTQACEHIEVGSYSPILHIDHPVVWPEFAFVGGAPGVHEVQGIDDTFAHGVELGEIDSQIVDDDVQRLPHQQIIHIIAPIVLKFDRSHHTVGVIELSA